MAIWSDIILLQGRVQAEKAAFSVKIGATERGDRPDMLCGNFELKMNDATAQRPIQPVGGVLCAPAKQVTLSEAPNIGPGLHQPHREFSADTLCHKIRGDGADTILPL
ncbi:hypothetical protein [uncultured Novosphingobium sp.]|uniref:hypothetical protein n=1 Tax=uncultured Novosphingobium sp. TaxID=292277 RepID=UPI0037488038